METLEEGEGLGFELVLNPKEERKFNANKKVELPKEVQELLQRYEGIVSDDQPSILPLREFLVIKLTLSYEILPNKAAYKMTPQQNEEISR